MTQPRPFSGYTEAQRGKDGFLYIKRMTDFSMLECHHRATEVATRQPFRGQATQGFIVTDAEASLLHRGG